MIKESLADIRQRIKKAALAAGRDPDSIKLLAVSKKQSLEKIKQAIAARQHCFAENYLLEALEKINSLKDEKIEWHYIGSIQSNKTRAISEHFSWVHSVDSLKIARRLDEQRPDDLPPLNICIQVNISNEPSKSGVTASEVLSLAQSIHALKHLRLRGLMVIPIFTDNSDEQYKVFRQLYDLQQQLITQGIPCDTLSMGMSQDFEQAIAAGSTIIRIGTAIFGER